MNLTDNLLITAGDCLAGGGGVTEALSQIEGVDVKWVLNHKKISIRTNIFNHKGVKHYWADMYKQDEHKMPLVNFVWASIECTQHSVAKGGKDKDIGSYMLGWELLRYLKFQMPMVIGIENVPEFKKWAPLRIREDKKHSTNEYSALTVDDEGNYVMEPNKDKRGEEFNRWKEAICALGYDYDDRIMNAADFGLPTRRVRYFAFFTRKELGLKIRWPEATHSKTGTDGKQKWVACKHYIDLTKEGESIFGREFNQRIRKNKRHPLSPNTLRRISGGIRKYAPELYTALQNCNKHFIMHYYSQGTTSQSIDDPLHTIPTNDRHLLITIEKMQFVQDYCRSDIHNTIDEPVSTQLTRQTKQLITIEKKFLADYYGRDDTAQSLDSPANTIRTENSKHLISAKFISKYHGATHKDGREQHHAISLDDPAPAIGTFDNSNSLISAKFISKQYSGDVQADSIDNPLPAITTIDHNRLISANFVSKTFNSNGKPEMNNHSIDEPMGALTTKEKNQFITAYFNSDDNPESQNQSIDSPLGTVLTSNNKKALITAFQEGLIDFDIKMRFLDPVELAEISTFPKGYFTHKELGLNRKEQTWLIGMAVPPQWAKIIIQPVIEDLRSMLMAQKMAV